MTLDWAQFYCLMDKSQISSNSRLGLVSMFEVLWHSWHGSWHWDVITLNLWHVTCDNCVPSNCPMSSLPSQPWLHLLILFPTQHHHPDHHCQLCPPLPSYRLTVPAWDRRDACHVPGLWDVYSLLTTDSNVGNSFIFQGLNSLLLRCRSDAAWEVFFINNARSFSIKYIFVAWESHQRYPVAVHY